MTKLVLFDLDGVIIRHKEYFSDSLSKDHYKNPGIILKRLYKSENNKKCDKGELNFFDYIKSFLDQIEWDKSIEDYLNLQYEFECQYIDKSLMERIKGIRSNEIRTGIASNQNQYRKRFLLKELDVVNVFDDYYFSSDIGFVKSENEFWEYVIRNLKDKYKELKNEDIIFLDDLVENTKKAKEFGINSYLIKSKKDIEEVLKKIEEKVV
jgi:FMN phosphatase YigB (HAD superfamily)